MSLTTSVSAPTAIVQEEGCRGSQVEQAARLGLRLEVGNVSESVEVSATSALLQTENASVGTVIDSGKIVDLQNELY